ncbi:baseplate J/gp47 family protein [Paenibacillus ginsengarvi]|uniref:baseplate J/gp47 family protein n=1 Tax=Paenibacillus ginsengarvi TaxID=400777 RepID=UPI0019615900|nr:baseplate J/gp47 family protein [Paenibacillus ginsengarvi]
MRDQLLSDARSIFGQDIYLESDSQDYQWISVVANIVYDSFLTSQAVYNARGPSTAIGSALDIIVKINGIKRLPAAYSTCYVTLTGSVGTIITGGVVADINGYEWTLTTPISIGSSGQATALATCKSPGPITANVGEINKITTPTFGWTAVTNPGTAVTGAYAETDAQLRSRQAISTAQSSQTVLEGVKGAIAAVSGVQRSVVYENDKNVTDANGLPPHSISAVVEGGSDDAIAQAIYNKKGLGCYTNGNVPVQITDLYGVAAVIRFSRPAYVDIDVTINLKQLSGYTTQTTTDIKSAIVAFINSLTIGDSLTLSSLWGAALSANSVPNKPTFSITGVTAARHGQPLGTIDIAIAYNEVTRGNVANIVVNVS